MWFLSYSIFLLLASPTICGKLYCSGVTYGPPNNRDCSQALAFIPSTDNYARFFIEQPLYAKLPVADWDAFVDPRPYMAQTQSVQLPKYWGHGSCNIALTSYVRGSIVTAYPMASWYTIYSTAAQLSGTCMAINQGGAAVVDGIFGSPVLSIFFWTNGARFEAIENRYTSSRYPSGIDPRHPLVLQTLENFNSSASVANSSANASYSAYPQILDVSNSSRTRLDGVAALVDSS